jgi:hypothetical protein
VDGFACELDEFGFDSLFFEDLEDVANEDGGVSVFAAASVESDYLHGCHLERVVCGGDK